MLAIASTLVAVTASGQAVPQGNVELAATLGAITLNVFTYRPANCTPRQLRV
jgi:hypothetical protein